MISKFIVVGAAETLQLVSCVLAQQTDDGIDPGPILFLIAMLGILAFSLIAAAVTIIGFIGFSIAALFVLSVVVLILVAAGLLHLFLAIIICTRRPPTRVLMPPRCWGALSLPCGIFAAIPFFVLHYRPGAKPRCYSCGYDRRGLPTGTVCPECGCCRNRFDLATKT